MGAFRLVLANRFDGLIRRGGVADYMELARLGDVLPARISQIMSSLKLVPEIQEALPFLARVQGGKDSVTERE